MRCGALLLLLLANSLGISTRHATSLKKKENKQLYGRQQAAAAV
jgi:hypothetical protein